MQPIVAFRALKRLIADPEQTEEVFNVIRALSGPALKNAYRRFRNTQTGQQILLERRQLLHSLQDREALAALPAHSLGRHYLQFMIDGNITADGLVEASEDRQETIFDPGMALFSERQRDMHDLWHTVTQYDRDELGEACLLAFTYAQTKNRGIGIICLAGAHKLAQHLGNGVYGAVWKAYQDGKRAAWLPAQDWEMLLQQPIDDVRISLGIPKPEQYDSLRLSYATA